MDEIILSMKNIEKYFKGVHALKNFHFDLRKGEVHSLIGENGAGKSTLMKVLSGIHKKDGGVIEYFGQPLEIKTPKDAQEQGICIVHQELNLMNHLTVAQNIYIGQESKRFMNLFLDDEDMNKKSADIFKRMNVDINPRDKISKLSVGKQQLVEIAKSLTHESKVLILDEPTAALTDNETKELFRIIKDLKENGVSIIYISHRLDELFIISDRVTIMRDGEYVDTKNIKDTNKNEIVSMMVGRVIYEDPKSESSVKAGAKVVLEVKHLSVGEAVHDASFCLHEGEVLGFAGLMGAGRTETARAIFGADKKDGGHVYIDGKLVNIENPFDAIANGIGYLSEDRKRYGLALGLSISSNVLLGNYDKFSNGIFADDNAIKKSVEEQVASLKIKTPSIMQLVKNLSGGNQQKVIIANWLVKQCRILIFDEPTRGIDVGAKSEIYKLINDLAALGKSIIMISSDLVEILRMSDRIIIMSEGRTTGELDISDASQESIMHYATIR